MSNDILSFDSWKLIKSGSDLSVKVLDTVQNEPGIPGGNGASSISTATGFSGTCLDLLLAVRAAHFSLIA
jgi:hypothetical protein